MAKSSNGSFVPDPILPHSPAPRNPRLAPCSRGGAWEFCGDGPFIFHGIMAAPSGRSYNPSAKLWLRPLGAAVLGVLSLQPPPRRGRRGSSGIPMLPDWSRNALVPFNLRSFHGPTFA